MAIGEYQPKTEATFWDEYVDRQIGQKRANELRAYQGRFYSTLLYGDTVERKRRAGAHVRAKHVDPFHFTRNYGAARIWEDYANRSMLSEVLGYGRIRNDMKRTKQIKADLSATAPAATAEQSWAGYVLKVEQLSKEQRQKRIEFTDRFFPDWSASFSGWRWLYGLHQVHTRSTAWQRMTYGANCLPVKEMRYPQDG